MVQISLLSIATLLSGVAVAQAYTIEVFSGAGYSGSYYYTSSSGTHQLGFKARSYIWDSAGGDGCCVKFCNGGTETGYWCPSHDNANVLAANQFNKVVTGCGSTTLNC